MEYVVVFYEDDRDVFIDGQLAGKTGDTLMAGTGNHFFDLGAPQDYVPANVSRTVENTTSISPMLIADFHPRANVI